MKNSISNNNEKLNVKQIKNEIMSTKNKNENLVKNSNQPQQEQTQIINKLKSNKMNTIKNNEELNVKSIKKENMSKQSTNENLMTDSNQPQRNLYELKIKLQNIEDERFNKAEELFKFSKLYKLIEKEGLNCDIKREKYRNLYLSSPKITIYKDKSPLLCLKSYTPSYFSKDGIMILNNGSINDRNYNEYLNPLGNPYDEKNFECEHENLRLYYSNDTTLPNYDMSLMENIELLKFIYRWDTERKEELSKEFLKLYEEFIVDYFKPLKALRDELIELEKIKISNQQFDKNNQIQRWLNGEDKIEIKGEPYFEKDYNDDYDVIGVKKILREKCFYTKYKGSNDKGHKERNIKEVNNITKIDKKKYIAQTDNEMVIFTTNNLTKLLSEIYNWNETGYYIVLGNINKILNKDFGIENPTDLDFDEVFSIQVDVII